MKKKFRVLSILSAIAVCATMGLTACEKGSVPEHDHVWNEGVVTKEPTCHSEGLRTYSCTVEGCKQTKTAPIGMTEHTWDGGTQTKDPTCKAEGVMTYTCTNEGCGQTKTSSIQKTEHTWDGGTLTKVPDFCHDGEKTYECTVCEKPNVVPVAAHADFEEMYYGSAEAKNNWKYGYASAFTSETGDITFAEATAEEGVWKAQGVEIAGGYVLSETDSHAVIAYGFADEMPEKIQAKVTVKFTGEESATALDAYLVLTNGEGEAVGEPEELNAEGKKDWEYSTAEAQDIEQGYTYYLVFENKGTGKAGGDLSFTIAAPCVHVWDGGKVTAESSCTVQGTRTYTCTKEGCGETREEKLPVSGHNIEGAVQKAPTLNAAGVKHYECSVCHAEETKYDEYMLAHADFFESFHGNDAVSGSWKYGYVDYDFDSRHGHQIQANGGNSETFDFTEATAYNAENGAWTADGGVEIKAGWISAGDAKKTAILYTAEADAKADLRLAFKGPEGKKSYLTARITVTDSADKYRYDFATFGIDSSHKNEWEVTFPNIALNSGDKIYVMLFREPDGDNYNGDFACTVTNRTYTSATANYAQDFHDDQTTNAWQYGKIDYDFDNAHGHSIQGKGDNSETFDFTPGEYADGAWTANEGKIKLTAGEITCEEGMAGILYTVPEAGKANIHLSFKGKEENNGFTVRIITVSAENSFKHNDGIYDAGQEYDKYYVNGDAVDVAAGDKIYFAIEHKGSNVSGSFALSITLTATNGSVTERGNLFNDFSTSAPGDWLYGYTDGYDFGNNTFTFSALTQNGADEWKNDNGKIILKKDYFQMDEKNIVVGYNVPDDIGSGLKVTVTYFGKIYTGDPRFSARVLVVDKDRNTKFVQHLNPGTLDWSAYCDLTVGKDDTVYVVLFHEGGWTQGRLQITVHNV